MVIAVDFDGTIVTHEYPKIGKPVPFALETLQKLQQEGHQLILWTVREGRLLQDAVNYCEQRGVHFYAVNANYPEETYGSMQHRKIEADVFIDDHNLGGLPEWGEIYQLLTEKKEKKSWWKSLLR